MGIYIKNIGMPTERNEMILRIQPDGAVFDKYAHYIGMFASYVPPHGRLIDAGAVNLDGGPYEDDEWYKWALDQYQDAPTVIPASKEEQEYADA